MIPILIGLGACVVFDWVVSATYFAKYVDKTTNSFADQAIRIVRVIVGIAIITLGVIIVWVHKILLIE